MSNDTPILVIQQEEHMSAATIASVYEMASQMQERLGVKVVFVEKDLSAKVELGTADLVAAMQENTAAISRLANSNQQVIDYLLSQEADDLDRDIDNAPAPYLDPDD